MKEDKKADHRIHVEFAHFSRMDFFSLFDKYVVKHADSLGMNE
jgi:ADP-dependent phosphofructokinase/glucokinase